MVGQSSLEYVSQVINESLKRATNAFSVMINCTVDLKLIDDLSIDFIQDYYEGESLHLFSTEIMGEYSGMSYLLINDIEWDAIKREMEVIPDKIEFLKELDNVISAAVISELSNHYQIDIFGDIPYHFKYESPIFKDTLGLELFYNKTSDFEEDKIVSISQFVINDHIVATYIWALNKSLINKRVSKV